MFPKPLLILGGSAIAIALGGTRLGPIVALLLVAVLSYVALTSITLTTNANASPAFTGQPIYLA